MLEDYSRFIASVCGDRWDADDTHIDERDGALGVAMVKAYLSGVRPSLNDFSSFLRIPIFALESSFRRLHMNGIFSSSSFALRDPLLKANLYLKNNESNMPAVRAWCHIAGMASGFVGKGFSRG